MLSLRETADVQRRRTNPVAPWMWMRIGPGQPGDHAESGRVQQGGFTEVEHDGLPLKTIGVLLREELRDGDQIDAPTSTNSGMTRRRSRAGPSYAGLSLATHPESVPDDTGR